MVDEVCLRYSSSVSSFDEVKGFKYFAEILWYLAKNENQTRCHKLPSWRHYCYLLASAYEICILCICYKFYANIVESYSEPCQTSQMELFEKKVKHLYFINSIQFVLDLNSSEFQKLEDLASLIWGTQASK